MRTLCKALSLLAICLGGLMTTLQAQQFEAEKFLPSDGAPNDQFGVSVSISGSAALIGARWDDDLGIDSGSAYVQRFDGTSWREEAKLLASDGFTDDEFGATVSISGEVALIGAYNDDDFGSASGSAYVYRFNGTTWLEEAKLLASDGSPGDLFGFSVSVSGDVAVIGAYNDGDNGPTSGSAYVFRYNGSAWREEQKLIASDGAPDDFFGYSVGVSQDVVLIGARYDDDNGPNSGSAYVFRFNGSRWVEEQKLLASDGAPDDSFAYSLSLYENVAIIGSYLDDDNGFESGSAYLYRFDGTRWTEEDKLLASDGAPGDNFGESVSISDGVAVVGARYHDFNGPNSGSAYSFYHNGARWAEADKLLASDGAPNDLLGGSICVSNGLALIGARLDDDAGIDSGSAYLFDVLRFGLKVSPSPLKGGQAAMFEVVGGHPSEPTFLIYSLDGGNCAQYYQPLNVILNVCNPFSQQPRNPLKTGFTNNQGAISWTIPLPGVGSSVPVWVQAVQQDQITPIVAAVIEP